MVKSIYNLFLFLKYQLTIYNKKNIICNDNYVGP